MNLVVIAFVLSLVVIVFGPSQGASSGQMAFAWIVAIFLGAVLAVALLKEIFGKKASTEENGIPVSNYAGGTWSPRRGGVSTPAYITPNELMSNHSNGWTWDKAHRAWRNDKTGEYYRWVEQ